MYFLRTPAGIMPMDKVRVRWGHKDDGNTAIVYLEEWRGNGWFMVGWNRSCPFTYVDKFFDELQAQINAHDHGCLNIESIWNTVVPLVSK